MIGSSRPKSAISGQGTDETTSRELRLCGTISTSTGAVIAPHVMAGLGPALHVFPGCRPRTLRAKAASETKSKNGQRHGHRASSVHRVFPHLIHRTVDSTVSDQNSGHCDFMASRGRIIFCGTALSSPGQKKAPLGTEVPSKSDGEGNVPCASCTLLRLHVHLIVYTSKKLFTTIRLRTTGATNTAALPPQFSRDRIHAAHASRATWPGLYDSRLTDELQIAASDRASA